MSVMTGPGFMMDVSMLLEQKNKKVFPRYEEDSYPDQMGYVVSGYVDACAARVV